MTKARILPQGEFSVVLSGLDPAKGKLRVPERNNAGLCKSGWISVVAPQNKTMRKLILKGESWDLMEVRIRDKQV